MSKKKININDVNKDYNFNLTYIDLDHIVVNPDKRVYVVLTDGERQSGFEINSYEGSMLSFVHKGLHNNSHIHTIHQLYIKALKQFETTRAKLNLDEDYTNCINTLENFVNYSLLKAH